jgi:hypothetical protein
MYHLVGALVRENLYKPIDGDVVLISRQTVYFTPTKFIDLLHSLGIGDRVVGECKAAMG